MIPVIIQIKVYYVKQLKILIEIIITKSMRVRILLRKITIQINQQSFLKFNIF
jgi:hypothetical protein